MSSRTSAQLLREGEPRAALKALQEEVRAEPGDPKLRVFLFQLLAVLGEWDRALNQLNVATQLDPSTLAMAEMYRMAIRCELLRHQVFSGATLPMVLGEPQEWVALLIESMSLQAHGRDVRALRARALDAAPATAGTMNGEQFEWVADADSRLGPVLEAMVNGAYYWVPFVRLRQIRMQGPADLRDFVWMPAQLQLTNGAEMVGLIPTRYVGSELADDDGIVMARKTEWQEVAPETFCGLGQRVLTSESREIGLMDVRDISFEEVCA